MRILQSNSDAIIFIFTSPNEESFEPKLYPQKSIFQRNKRYSRISSIEEVMANLFKIVHPELKLQQVLAPIRKSVDTLNQ